MESNNTSNNNNSYISDDEIDLKELALTLWRGKWIIIATTVIAAVIAVVYALSLPNIYRSEVLLSPVEDQQAGGLAGLANQFGGLASLAGVSLGGAGNDKTTLALELLKSRTFLSEFIEKHQLKAPLMATEGWDSTNNTLIYNSEIYDVKNKKWVREAKAPKKPEPSLLEAHEYFLKHNLQASKDKKTGLVTVAVKHFSPFVAQKIAADLVASLNKKMKNDDIAEAEKSIAYLQGALEQTKVADMQKVFYQLIEQQQQTKMLANVRDEYVLKVIDPPVVAEKKVEPKRAIIAILGVLIGGFFGAMIVFIRQAFRKNN